MRNMAYLIVLASAGCLIGAAAGREPPGPPPRAAAENEAGDVKDLCRRLVDEAADLQDDLRDVSGEAGHTLQRQSGEVLEKAYRLRRALRDGAPQERLGDDAAALDKEVRELMEGVENLGPEARSLKRSASRIRDIERRLYASLTPGDASDEGVEGLKRRIDGWLAHARRFNQATQYAAKGNPDGRRLADDANEFVEAAERLDKGLDQGADRDRLRRDFVKVNEAWGRTVADLQTFPPVEGNRGVFLRAQEVSTDYEDLFQRLKVEGERVRFKDRD